MKVLKFNNSPRPINQTNSRSSFFSKSLSVTYGSIDSNNTDSTCNVLLKSGFVATNIRLLSTVFPSKDPTYGGVNYPQIEAEVLIIHPEGDLSSGFIIPSPLDVRDDTVKTDLFDQGDITLLPGGWKHLYDKETGKAQFLHGDFFSLIADPDTEKVTFVDFKQNKITTDTNGMLLEDLNGNTISMEAATPTTKKVLINGNLEILQ